MAEVGVELRKTRDQNAKLWHAQREWERSRVPSYVRQFNSVVIPAGGARTGFGFPGPRAGFYMLLRRLIVGGTTWKTTAAGTAEIYVTGLPSGAIGGLALSDMVDQAPSLPNKAYYSNQQIVVNNGEHVEVVIDTGTAAQTYVGTALFEVWRTLSGETVFES
jgi:hypothetical protein